MRARSRAMARIVYGTCTSGLVFWPSLYPSTSFRQTSRFEPEIDVARFRSSFRTRRCCGGKSDADFHGDFLCPSCRIRQDPRTENWTEADYADALAKFRGLALFRYGAHDLNSWQDGVALV